MKKRFFSLALALIMIFGACFSFAYADENTEIKLRFDNAGEFKIMHISDCQDKYPAIKTMITFIDAALKQHKPDLVVLGGDNTISEYETKEQSIKELCDIFVSNKTPFTLVFGNHDCEQGYTNDELLEFYQKYGDIYFLGYDADPSLHGCATHNLTVWGSVVNREVYNIWLFDSGSKVLDENGKKLGYDCVRADQIQWYINKGNEYAAMNAGRMLPSIAFQHIVVGEVYDALFYESPVELGELTRNFNGKTYSFFPKTENFSGHLLEFPCPGVDNEGQFQAMVDQGDVVAIFSGHDHTNSFITELDGIKIINTPGVTFNSYSSPFNQGVRMITVKEGALDTIETEIVSVNGLAAENSDFASAADINGITARIIDVVGDILLSLSKFSGIFSNFIRPFV